MRGLPPVSLCALVAVLGGACVDGPGDGAGLPDASFETYAAEVEPVLATRCGQSSCHGTDERPLGLFVVPHHRLPGSEGPTTDEEVRANYDRARSFLVFEGDPADAPLLAEPLAVSEGGVHHEPGPVFQSTVEHEYQALLRWAQEAQEGGP